MSLIFSRTQRTHGLTNHWFTTQRGIRVSDDRSQTTANIHQDTDTLYIATPHVEIGLPVGHRVRKDMHYGFNGDEEDAALAPELPAAYAPLGTEIPGETHTASYWDDWGNDIFDDWGYFYIFDVPTRQFYFPFFERMNEPDGVLNEQTFEAFGRTYTITHGYGAQGIYKFHVTCSDETPFIFGAYGDMGSDEDGENTNLTHTYTRDGQTRTLYYNRNIEKGDRIERLFSYFIPVSASLNTSKTYRDFVYDEDKLSLFSVPVTNGITVYFSKKSDVKEWVVRDLAGMTPEDTLCVNGHAQIKGTVDAERLQIHGADLLPVATVLFYAGQGVGEGDPPPGWLFCNGQEHNGWDYPRLAQALGATMNEGTYRFTVPDLPTEGGPRSIIKT